MTDAQLRAQAAFYLEYLTTTKAMIGAPNNGPIERRVAIPQENFSPAGWRDQAAFMCQAVLSLTGPHLTWATDSPHDDLVENIGFVKGCFYTCHVFTMAEIAGHGDLTEWKGYGTQEKRDERRDAETSGAAEHAPGHRCGAD